MKRVAGGGIVALISIILIAGRMADAGGSRVQDLGPISNATEAVAIRDAFEGSVRVHGEAARTLSTDQFVTVFINDGRFPLTAKQAGLVSKSKPEASANAGYLTYMTAYFEQWQRGAQALTRIEAARARGAAPALADTAIFASARTDPWVKPTFEYKSINASPDASLATLEAVGDGQIYRVTMVKSNGRWYVAAENNTPLT